LVGHLGSPLVGSFPGGAAAGNPGAWTGAFDLPQGWRKGADGARGGGARP
jgi:hypothetical protein